MMKADRVQNPVSLFKTLSAFSKPCQPFLNPVETLSAF